MELKDKHIVVVSNEPWGDIWYSKHNYAYELSRRNKVVFVDPCGRWSLVNLFRSSCSLRRISPNLSILRYGNALPIRSRMLFNLNEWIIAGRIRRTLSGEGSPIDLFLSFDPSRLVHPAWLDAGRSLFIAVDAYLFSFYGEREMHHNVDGIVTISETLSKAYLRFEKPILTLSHAISRDEFDAVPAALPFTEYGLYVGGLDKRVDFGTLERMVSNHPDIPFVFIGNKSLQQVPEGVAFFQEGRHANVHYLGAKPFKELKSYIKGARFCLAPMDHRVPGNHISHHKIFQYLAMGKPVFSTVFTEYRPLDHLLYMSDDTDRLLERLDEFIRHGELVELAQARIELAGSCTYEVIFERMSAFIARLPAT